MIVATAGHIDHGKTTLVKALTGVDTDRLPEEKKRGISIDLGFAYWKTPGDARTIGFVDVPGHERFVRNMLAGVCGIDFVLFVVAADDGIMPQTIEHLRIVELLAVKNGVAVVTKADRVPPGRAAEVAANVKSLLASTALAAIEVLPVSATTGSGMERLREVLAGAAKTLDRRRQRGRRLRFAIDRVFSIAGSGTVATGTVFDGEVKPGDRLLLSPSGREVRVRAIQKDGAAAGQAVAGERCALNLSGIEVADAARGDWVLDPALHAPTQRLDVRVTLLDAEARALRHWTPVHLHHGAEDVTARVAIRRGAEIRPGESGLAQLVTDRPVAALRGDRFILRDQSALRTIGGGSVIDPHAPLRRPDPSRRAAQLEALQEPEPQSAFAALLDCTPAGVDIRWFARIVNLDDAAGADLVARSGVELLGKDPALALRKDALDAIRGGVLKSLAEFHAANPRAIGMEIADLRRQCAPKLAADAFQALLRALLEAKRVEVTGSAVRLPRHVATDNPADEKLWQQVRPPLQQAAFNGLTVTELAAAARVKEALLSDFLHRKAKTGDLVRVTADRFYLRGTLARFALVAIDAHKAAADGRFSAAQVRDRTDIGRTRAIQILECFDRLGITQRIGDLRTIRRDYRPILGPAES